MEGKREGNLRFLEGNLAKKGQKREILLCQGGSTGSNPNIVPLRFARLVFGVTSSRFILNATLRHHVDRYLLSDPEFVYELLR